MGPGTLVLTPFVMNKCSLLPRLFRRGTPPWTECASCPSASARNREQPEPLPRRGPESMGVRVEGEPPAHGVRAQGKVGRGLPAAPSLCLQSGPSSVWEWPPYTMDKIQTWAPSVTAVRVAAQPLIREQRPELRRLLRDASQDLCRLYTGRRGSGPAGPGCFAILTVAL